MNQLVKHIWYIFMIIILSACSEDFVDNPPLTQATDEYFPQSANDALLATNAVYGSMRNWWYMGGYPLLNIMADDQTKGSEDGSNPDLQQFEDFTYSPTHAYILSWYQAMYQTIKYAHVVIEGTKDIDMDPEKKARYIAEARFIRAHTYFNLVRLFGDLVKVTEIFPSRELSRSPAQEIYNEIIIPDLLNGVDVLPIKSDYPPGDYGRITQGACKALLARVYLHLHDYENAEKYALEVIQSGQYWLEPDFKKVFSTDGQFGSGSIFELGALPEGRVQGGNQYGNTQGVRGEPNWGWGFGRPSWDFLNSFETGDPRLEASVIYLGEVVGNDTIVGNGSTTDTTYVEGQIVEIECYNQKVQMFGAEDVQTNWGFNRRIIRYADVLLMAAEALNENDKPDDALIYLNLVRERARGDSTGILPDITETNKDLLRQIIWKERRAELAFEDIRYYDLMRQGRMYEVLGKYGFIEGKHEKLPIPQQEIDISEGRIEQNSEWI